MTKDLASEVRDLGPLRWRREQNCIRLCLATPEQFLLEVPADYEQVLRSGLLAGAPADATFVMDLAGVPAISSRHLGVLLTVQKVLRDRIGALPVVNVSDGVRRLFELTRTDRFFSFE